MKLNNVSSIALFLEVNTYMRGYDYLLFHVQNYFRVSDYTSHLCCLPSLIPGPSLYKSHCSLTSVYLYNNFMCICHLLFRWECCPH